MRHRQLGKSDLSVSVVGIGGLHFGNLCDQQQTCRIIHKAQDFGVNFIDTAPMYGNTLSESFIGVAIRGRRDSFVIASKVGLTPAANASGQFGVATVSLNEAVIRKSVDSSLAALNIDRLDLLQLHAFDNSVPIHDTLSALEKLIREGKIRWVGCSNYDHEQLQAVGRAVHERDFSFMVSLQSHYNVLERRLERDLLPLCKDYELGI
ncbi:MAG: aldo/keto reductase, partial [bacterium]